MYMRILVMAHGRGERMKPAIGDMPKQLINLFPAPLDEPYDPTYQAGWSILERTLWLLNGCNADVVTVGPVTLGAVANRNSSWLMGIEDPGYCILDGLLATRDWWDSDRTVVLLGDVVFSRRALAWALSSQRPAAFVGTSNLTQSTGELFAMSFTGAVHDYIKRLIHEAPCRHAGHQIYQPGHLRNIAFEMIRNGAEYTALPPDDYTDDIDVPEDLQNLPTLAQRAHADLMACFNEI